VRAGLAARPSPTEAIVDCLREYIEIDAQYRLKAIGEDCNCGVCLLCRAREALDGFAAEHD
jgi:ribosomal protein S12 methylthiotransferase accessory factor YcaO